MIKWTNDEIELIKKLIQEEKTSKEIGLLLNRTNRSIERKLSHLKLYRPEKKKKINYCKLCNKETKNDKFCSHKCSALYNNSIRDKSVYEKISKKLKENKYERHKRCGNEENQNRLLNCKYCNVVIVKGKCCKECKKWYHYINLFKKMNTFVENVGLNIINDTTINILSNLYFNCKLSKIDLTEKFGIDTRSIYVYFKKNNLTLRNLSEATSNAIMNGKKMSTGSYMYKSGWHTTWENKNFFYRSSYELGYAKFLDENKIPYEMEFKRFIYFDTQENKKRIAIPDFYLPLENKIIEIKSSYTYNEIEMDDKIKMYKSMGYCCELLMEKELKLLGIKIKD